MSSSAATEPGGEHTPRVNFERIRHVADAILYEGYLLYPYQKSSTKNRVRWQFGVLAPRDWVERDGPVRETVAGSVESWRQQTECLLQAAPSTGDATVHVRVRFLQLQAKRVERRAPGGGLVPVESVEVGGALQLSFDEAVPHESDAVASLPELLAGKREFAVAVPGGEQIERLGDGARIVRTRWPLSAVTTLRVRRLDDSGVYRLQVRTRNTAQATAPGASREEALRHSLIATHTLIGAHGLAFGSLIDPAAWAAPHTARCRNVHTFPVLAGEPGAEAVLSSPILLYDYPEIAPESPADLHDAAEIDEILSLRTLTLTDEEKREARATDPRAAAIVDRIDGMPDEVMARLHGAVRSLRPHTSAGTPTEGEA